MEIAEQNNIIRMGSRAAAQRSAPAPSAMRRLQQQICKAKFVDVIAVLITLRVYAMAASII